MLTAAAAFYLHMLVINTRHTVPTTAASLCSRSNIVLLTGTVVFSIQIRNFFPGNTVDNCSAAVGLFDLVITKYVHIFQTELLQNIDRPLSKTHLS
jgi:hypothetical protein